MADNTTNEQIIFQVKIDSEQYKAEQKLIRDSLGQVTLDIEKTREAQKSLDATRKAGKVGDAEYSQQSVKLREELKQQRADQRELEKGLATSQKAYNSAAGSVEQLRAALFEAKQAYYAMSEAERQSAEGQELQKKALAISDALSKVERSVGQAGRDVGKYGQAFSTALEPAIVALVKLQEQAKLTSGTSPVSPDTRNQIKGFQTEAARLAAEMGLNAEQAEAKFSEIAGKVQPAVAALVQLEAQQQEVAESAGELSDEYRQIGFRIGEVKQQIEVASQGPPVVDPAPLAVVAGSLADLRNQLLALQATRETLDPTTQDAKELNTEILVLKTRIAEGAGQIDEFGEKIQRNIKREQFDTLTDALGGLSAGLGSATILFGDNTNAEKAEAKALQLTALAMNAKAIAVGLASAPEALHIGYLKVKGLLLRDEATLSAAAAVSTEAHAAVAGADAAAIEAQAVAAGTNAEAQVASAAGTLTNTVATEAQAVATGKATVLQALLNRVMLLSPIGWLVLAVGALVGAFLAYSNASDKTQAKVHDFTKTLLLFTNPIGLAIVGIEKLYSKFESVRKILDPLIEGVERFGAAVGAKGRALGEFIGLLDTLAEKAAARAKADFEQAEQRLSLYDAQATAQEQAGQRIENVRATLRKKLELDIERSEKLAATERTANEEKLQDIARRKATDEDLSKSQQELLNKTLENETRAQTARNNLRAFELEGIELVRAARAQAAADVENNAQRSADSSRRQIEESIASQKAALQSRVSTLDRQLAVVRLNSDEELQLQRKRIAAQRDLELLNLGPTLAQERALRAQNLGRILADQEASRQLEVAQHGLTEEQKAHINDTYRNKAQDARRAFSTKAAQDEVAARREIGKNATAADLKLTTDHLRQVGQATLQAEQARNAASLAANQQAQAQQATQGLAITQQQLAEQYQLQRRAVTLERELALASLDVRKDNAAAELRIRAEASQKLAELEAAQADAARQRRAQELSEEAAHYTLLADGMLAGLTQGEQAQVQATETYKQQRLAALLDEQDAKLALVAKGSQDEVNIRQETQNKVLQLQQDSHQAQLALLKSQTDKVASVITGSLSSLAAIQDADSQAKLARLDAEMNKEGVSAARHAVLEKQKVRAEQEAAEQRKKIARAQAVVQLGAAILTILAEESVLPSPLAEIAKAVEIAATTATAYAQFRAMDSAKFAQGGIAYGPSHARGGIQLTRQGRAVGIEIEGGEAIINKRSTALFGPVLSAINQLGGGRPFYVDPKPAQEWARLAEGGMVPRNLPEYLPQVRTGGIVVHTPPIDYDALAAALAARPADHQALANTLADVLTDRLPPAFVAGAQALPVPSLNLTELRERNAQLDNYQSQINI